LDALGFLPDSHCAIFSSKFLSTLYCPLYWVKRASRSGVGVGVGVVVGVGVSVGEEVGVGVAVGAGAEVGAAVGAVVGVGDVACEGEGSLGGFVGINTAIGGGGVGVADLLVVFARSGAKMPEPEPFALAAVLRKREKTQNESNDMNVYPANFLNIVLSYHKKKR